MNQLTVFCIKDPAGNNNTPDDNKAIWWYKQSTKLGNDDAMFSLGRLHLSHKVSVKAKTNPLEIAQQWFKKAATKNSYASIFAKQCTPLFNLPKAYIDQRYLSHLDMQLWNLLYEYDCIKKNMHILNRMNPPANSPTTPNGQRSNPSCPMMVVRPTGVTAIPC